MSLKVPRAGLLVVANSRWVFGVGCSVFLLPAVLAAIYWLYPAADSWEWVGAAVLTILACAGVQESKTLDLSAGRWVLRTSWWWITLRYREGELSELQPPAVTSSENVNNSEGGVTTSSTSYAAKLIGPDAQGRVTGLLMCSTFEQSGAELVVSQLKTFLSGGDLSSFDLGPESP
ncbi:MAG: hypothetical protein JKY65_20780 [Planctomycetes bacterium]|nr:hypothetical protein [Planctomycetota bacterium]